MAGPDIVQLRRSFRRAREWRAPWEQIWRDCYAQAMPMRGFGLGSEFAIGARLSNSIFDGTAADAVEQLGASLLAHLTPPWSRWLGLRPGHDVPTLLDGAVAEHLDAVAERIQGYFDRSNFAVEIHQCFLDLATIGTATLLFQEAPIGSASAFRFLAVPAAEVFIEGDEQGGIRTVFRLTTKTRHGIRAAYPAANFGASLAGDDGDATQFAVVEAASPTPQGCTFAAFLADEDQGDGVLSAGRFEHSPFLVFRWLKGAGETYGRSPVMTALPDIKTANRVVELVPQECLDRRDRYLARRRRWGAESGQCPLAARQRHPESPWLGRLDALANAGSFRRLAVGARRPARTESPHADGGSAGARGRTADDGNRGCRAKC